MPVDHRWSRSMGKNQGSVIPRLMHEDLLRASLHDIMWNKLRVSGNLKHDVQVAMTPQRE